MDRLILLKKLLNCEKPLSKIQKELSIFPWDSEPLIILKKDMLNYVISKYKNNIISEEELVEWANLIECRDDIVFEKEYEKQIKKTIFSIANPDLVDKEYIKNINSL
jgi:hypothetical protein